jgi:hypothetical protein
VYQVLATYLSPKSKPRHTLLLVSAAVLQPISLIENSTHQGKFKVQTQHHVLLQFLDFSVGTYNISFKRKQIARTSFGGKIRHKPATITLCAQEQRDRCQKCNGTPEIDYWKHFRLNKCYCHACMQTEVLDCNANVKIKHVKFRRLKLLREYEVRHHDEI